MAKCYSVRFYNFLQVVDEIVTADNKDDAKEIINDAYPLHGDFICVREIKEAIA